MTNKMYCVAFEIHNPPRKDGWEWVDVAINEITGTYRNGDFGDGDSGTYFFEDEKEAIQVFDLLKNLKEIGTHKKFKISNVRIYPDE